MKEFLKDIGKSILKKLIIFGIVLAVIAASIAGCSLYDHIKNMPSRKDAKMYKKYEPYRHYDYHLKCCSKEDYITEPLHTSYEVSDGKKLRGIVKFQQISDVDENQFVYAYWERPIPLGSIGYEKIMQNPDNYIDVFKDWTITKIEFICYESWQGEPTGTYTNDMVVIMSTTDKKIISDLKNCIINDKTEDELKDYKSYDEKYYSDKYINSYIRVYFAESDNIVWETEIFRYLSEEKESSLIYIDSGKAVDRYWNANVTQSLIYNYPELQNWIEESFASLDED